MVETDYCGLKTGKKIDKAALFDVFYGELETAPMIRQCPVNMELKLHDVLDFRTHDIFVGAGGTIGRAVTELLDPAKAYKASIEGDITGQVMDVREYGKVEEEAS
ncbi:flavoredoxin [Olavius algarvensis associated proteobacterium Delta 3]|nr:flavoredoxin [Olavius algarvensis associated proteobacterium Delta 3]CAB5157159.1 flavoredoxin [Olavius algarvensis associated proteobacterium Delta 3]